MIENRSAFNQGPCLAVCVFLGLCTARSSGEWTTTRPHPADGVSSTYAYGVSEGRQVGYTNSWSYDRANGHIHALKWRGSAASEERLPCPYDSIAFAIDGDAIAGEVIVQPYEVHVTLGEYRPGLWRNAFAEWVPLAGASRLGIMTAVSGDRQVRMIEPVGFPGDHACMWQGSDASLVDLHPAGASSSAANAIEDLNFGGYAAFGSANQACIWRGMTHEYVDLHPAAAQRSVVNAIHRGRQAGSATVGGVLHATLWSGSATSFVDLTPDAHAAAACYAMHEGVEAGIYSDGTARACVGADPRN